MESPKTFYFDHAAATPLDERVFSAMIPYFSENFYNPSSPYEPARQVRRDIELARQRIARLIGGKPDEVVFTAGATESVNILFNSILTESSSHCVTIVTEHHAVLEVAKSNDHTIVPVDEKGRVNVDDLVAAITPQTQLVSVSLANNEIGTLHPIKEISSAIKLINKQRHSEGNHTQLFLHVDASQGVGVVDIHVSRLGVDAMTLNASKVYGPKQLGVLWTTSELSLQPFIKGGGQEGGIRSGTENVPAIIGSALAFELAEKVRKNETKHLAELRHQFEKGLQSHLPEAIIPGATKHHLPHILTVSFPGVDAERLVFALESRNILVATGAACAANKATASHVLTALGLSNDLIAASIRISFGRATTSGDVDHLLGVLSEVVPKERQYGL